MNKDIAMALAFTALVIVSFILIRAESNRKKMLE